MQQWGSRGAKGEAAVHAEPGLCCQSEGPKSCCVLVAETGLSTYTVAKNLGDLDMLLAHFMPDRPHQVGNESHHHKEHSSIAEHLEIPASAGHVLTNAVMWI